METEWAEGKREEREGQVCGFTPLLFLFSVLSFFLKGMPPRKVGENLQCSICLDDFDMRSEAKDQR